jgi:hypothetical protein
MSKKHFIALADAIKNSTALITLTQVQIEALADFCQAQNSNFNRERWLGYIAGTNGKNGGFRLVAERLSEMEENMSTESHPDPYQIEHTAMGRKMLGGN